MVYPGVGRPLRDAGGPAGFTYAAVLVRLGGGEDGRCSRPDVQAALRRMRFTGWVAPQERDWVVAVPAGATVTVAARRRDVIGLGAALATDLRVPVLVIRVLSDRQLVLIGWRDGQEIGRYVSDPSFDHQDRTDMLTEPVGVEDAGALADLCGRPEVHEKLIDLLITELDADSFIESERLSAVLNLLQLPTWVVSVAALPRSLPTGPRRADFTRLNAGAQGISGLLRRWGSSPARRQRRRPPVIADPPRETVEIDPWLF
jgi:hypothetical protein